MLKWKRIRAGHYKTTCRTFTLRSVAPAGNWSTGFNTIWYLYGWNPKITEYYLNNGIVDTFKTKKQAQESAENVRAYINLQRS